MHIIDTAGLRETSDQVEQIGIERTWKAIDKADIACCCCWIRATA